MPYRLRFSTVATYIFLLFMLQIGIFAFPYPHPHPHPVLQQSNTQQQQLDANFDKSNFKPPELEETIEEVQKILQKDPTLPRLTRGEIEELYEKVTREEYHKSVDAGDLGRADSMRALMLVLPFNTDNSTAAENLQELYTRTPVTRVIDSYTPHQPIKFITPDPNAALRTSSDGSLSTTTYKPGLPFNGGPNPTTYHPPPPPPALYKLAPTETLYDFQPITNPISKSQLNFQPSKPVQRFSSHYNAKNTDFVKMTAQQKQQRFSTVRPVADVLETLGIVGNIHSRNRLGIDDYLPAESAPRPVISSYVHLNGAEFDGLRGQSGAPKIRPDAYASFKPLNIGEEIRVKPEVEDYLTRFGIVGGRKRKAMKKSNAKTETNVEQTGAGTELKSSSLSLGSTNFNNPSELEKLLENLQELERLNLNRKTTKTTQIVRTTKTPSTTVAPTTTTTTPGTTTTTPTTKDPAVSLITNDEPLLVEAKKPRRRIDPHIDINFGTTGNQQPIQSSDQQLSKLLENLQELEKLRLNPENVIKSVSPTIKAARVASKPLLTTTTAATKTKTSDQIQLQRLLKELQTFEGTNAKSTTKKPQIVRPTTAPALDLLQLRKLLTDDNELERLYEQARQKITPKITTTTTTTTTSKPFTRDIELEQLQKYLAELDKVRVPTTTSTTTTTTTTTALPITTTTTNNKNKQIDSVGDAQIQQLLNRVQQLEQLNSNQLQHKTSTETSMPYLGFTSRNVKASAKAVPATATDYRVPSNDFAQLQQLYRQVQEADKASFAHVEISTAASTPKHAQSSKTTLDLAERLIDITNDTGAESSLQTVDPNDFVQLQKLLSKVQELERVKITNGFVETTTPMPISKSKHVTFSPNLATAASIQAPNIQHPSAQLIYPEKTGKHKYVEFLEEAEDLKIDLPAYKPSQDPTTVTKKSSAVFKNPSSSEELKEIIFAKPINPRQSKPTASDKEFEDYQKFFSSLDDGGERNSYHVSYENLEPPMIQKTVTKEPPRYFPTKKPHDVTKSKPLNGQQQADLAELQKLLSNAQELEKLGITLPKSLSDQIESKLTKTNSIKSKSTLKKKGPIEPEVNIYLDRYGLKPKTTIATPEDSSEKVAVFSLTTPKSVVTKPSKPTTDSPLELPVFSATKIIEAAIKQAANRIGVTTEQPQGFRRRSDDNIDELEIEDTDEDMVGDFSEMNYQIAIPEINRMDELNDDSKIFKTENEDDSKNESDTTTSTNLSDDLSQLQRLIGNLQELQKLNVSISNDMLKLADTKYLESFKNKLTTADETNKSRRQSATPAAVGATSLNTTMTNNNVEAATSESTITSSVASKDTDNTISTVSSIETTPTAPTRVTLGIGVYETDADVSKNTNNEMSTSSSSTTSTTTEGTTTTEESRNGSLSDLEASFGPDPNKEEPLPPKKKNGFYFLADWNSFLEVGDGDDQVVVRFSPKIGDPRLFLPVKIP